MTTTDGRSQLRKRGRAVVIPTQALILRFRIELQETDPLVWREIEVPGDYTFWDLHVDIQDAMGWQDYHLHRFTMAHPRTKKEQIFGIHHLGQDCDDPPGWATQLASMYTLRNNAARYEYDFGDDWQHTVPCWMRCSATSRSPTRAAPTAPGLARPRTAVVCTATPRSSPARWTTTPAPGCRPATTRRALTRRRCASTTQPTGWPMRGMGRVRWDERSSRHAAVDKLGKGLSMPIVRKIAPPSATSRRGRRPASCPSRATISAPGWARQPCGAASPPSRMRSSTPTAPGTRSRRAVRAAYRSPIVSRRASGRAAASRATTAPARSAGSASTSLRCCWPSWRTPAASSRSRSWRHRWRGATRPSCTGRPAPVVSASLATAPISMGSPSSSATAPAAG
jgi:hypothetical protein